MFDLFFADAAAVFANDPPSLHSMLKDIEVHVQCNKWVLRLNINNIYKLKRDVQRKYFANTVDKINFPNSKQTLSLKQHESH